MDIKQKKSILFHLANKAEPGSTVLQAIQKECTRIIEALKNETQYELLSEQLDLLDTIAYRVYGETVSTIGDFLGKLRTLELTYQDVQGYPVERIREFQNNSKLMVKAIEVLEHIRYHQPSEILDIFFEYSCHEEENVAKQAKHGIEKFAGYHLDIFYGDGEDWPGLGWEPQEKVLEKIASFDDKQKEKYYAAIITACNQALSPTISGTSSTYKTITWRTGAIPASEGVKDIRKKALEELESLYDLSVDVEQKKTVLHAMETAMRTPNMGGYGDDVLAMVIEDAITVAEFMKRIALAEDMQLKQKIEHDAYWMLYHKGTLNEQIREIALEIRDVLYADEEYQKFRILIGFESIFHDWEKGGRDSDDYEHERTYRETEALNFAESVTTDTYGEWKDRIIRYASIKSNDLATFPYFGKFLEYLGKSSPELALQLLNENAELLENFITAILYGVAETDHEGAYALIERWCDEGKYLFSLARFFEYSSEVNEELLAKIQEKAKTTHDLNTLNQIISSVSARYNAKNKHLIKKFFIPVLEVLTTHKNTGWLFGFWFRKQSSDILTDMEIADHKAILDNLLWLNEIDYHAEEVLCVIAKQLPDLVVQFFCERLSKEKDEESTSRYAAVPFSFHKLAEPLSIYPEQAVDAVLSTYDGNYGLFIYGGAKLLNNIFPNYPLGFQQKLLEVIQSKEEKDLLFVIAILRNYEGSSVIHDVCKEIIKILPDGSDLENELSIILQSTGVVSGEYGFVEAYKQKIEEIQSWLQDDDSKVQVFAQSYIESLELQIEKEQKRADENIVLRKHLYGSDEDYE